MGDAAASNNPAYRARTAGSAPQLTEALPTESVAFGMVPLEPIETWSHPVPLPDSAVPTVDHLTALAAALAAAAEEARGEGNLALARELDSQEARVRAEARRT